MLTDTHSVALDITTTAVLFVMAIVATATDVKSGKVYNWLTAPGAVIGIALNIAFLGLAGLKTSMLGLSVGIAVWFVMPVIGKPLGGGDCKLLAAVGALRGPKFALYVLVLSGLWAGVIAVVVALRRRRLLASCRQVCAWVVVRITTGDRSAPEETTPGLKVPFAAAIALAALTTSLILTWPVLG